jgi:hypothetical protein
MDPSEYMERNQYIFGIELVTYGLPFWEHWKEIKSVLLSANWTGP